MFLCGLCDVKPMLSGNTAPVKHPQLIAVVRKSRCSEAGIYPQFSCRVWEGNCLGTLGVTLNPAVAGFRKGEK